MKVYLSLLCLFIFLGSVSSQADFSCGSEPNDEDLRVINEVMANHQVRSSQQRNDIITIPVAFHLIGRFDESGLIDSSLIIKELSKVNARYAEAGLFFRPCAPFNIIYDDEYADFQKFTDETICDQHDVDNVLNIYSVPSLFKIDNFARDNICGYAYFSNRRLNRLLIDNDCAVNGSTLAHEIGHYFSILHTHSTANGRELANGENCDSAGDKICDTPADPVLSGDNVNGNCIYTGTLQDSNGDFYSPNPSNIMSYAPKYCRTIFTKGQSDRIRAYAEDYRNYLECENFSTSTENLDETLNYRVWPNPALDLVNMSFYSAPELINIFDSVGNLIEQKANPKNEYILDVSNYSKGIYFYTFVRNNKLFTGKFTKLNY